MYRTTQLEILKEWLMENMPQTPVEERTMNYISNSDRKKLLSKKTRLFKEKCRITKALIARIALKTALNEDITIKAANTILEMMEKELTKGYKVIIEHFGEFKVSSKTNSKNYDLNISFSVNDLWLKSFNDPIHLSELGLSRKVNVGKKRSIRKLR